MIVACLGLKGGTGKTTIASGLAGTLATAGRRVATIDLDPLGCLHQWSGRAAKSAPTLIGIRGVGFDAEWVRAMGRGFDLVVLDCGGADRAGHAVALACADWALIPVSPSPVECQSLGATFDLVSEVPGRATLGLVANRVDRRTGLGRQIRGRLQRTGAHVFESQIGSRVAHAESWIAGACVAQHCDRSAHEFAGLWRELDGHKPSRTAYYH